MSRGLQYLIIVLAVSFLIVYGYYRLTVPRSKAELTIYTYESAVEMLNATIPGFEKLYNCKVNVELLTDDPDAIMKLRAGATRQFHIMVLNNCWSRGMYKDGLIKPLDKETFKPFFKDFPPRYHWPYKWAMADDGNLLGMPQRYGPFNFVINNKGISKKTAEDEGWNLFSDKNNKGRWALLNWDNWVLYQMCQGAGVYPFKKHSDEEMKKVEEMAFTWFKNAKFVTESEVEVNNALINGEIDFVQSFGMLTTGLFVPLAMVLPYIFSFYIVFLQTYGHSHLIMKALSRLMKQ